MYRKILYNEEFKKFCKFFFELNKASLIVPPVLFFFKTKNRCSSRFLPAHSQRYKELDQVDGQSLRLTAIPSVLKRLLLLTFRHLI